MLSLIAEIFVIKEGDHGTSDGGTGLRGRQPVRLLGCRMVPFGHTDRRVRSNRITEI